MSKDQDKSKMLFQEINEAYQILSDDELKRRYDNLINNIVASSQKVKKDSKNDFENFNPSEPESIKSFYESLFGSS